MINFVLGKNGGHTPSSLGGRSVVVVRQADKIFAVYKFLKSTIVLNDDMNIMYSILHAP